MKDWVQRNYYFVLTIALIMMLGWQTYSDLNSIQRESALNTLTSSRRMPAAVPESLPVAMTADLGDVITWNCSEKHEAVHQVANPQVRLKFPDCASRDLKKIIDIKNENNGTSATVFALSNSRFETDLIALAPGNNKISLSYVNSKGRTIVQTLQIQQIERRPTAD